MENQTIPRMPISAFVTNKRLKTNHSHGPKKTFTYNRISSILKSFEKKNGDPFLQRSWDKKVSCNENWAFIINGELNLY
jgi:hypothetical protein